MNFGDEPFTKREKIGIGVFISVVYLYFIVVTGDILVATMHLTALFMMFVVWAIMMMVF